MRRKLWTGVWMNHQHTFPEEMGWHLYKRVQMMAQSRGIMVVTNVHTYDVSTVAPWVTLPTNAQVKIKIKLNMVPH